jgi:Transposase
VRLGRRREDILAFFDHHASNGPTEAINGRVEALRRNAPGFRNLTHYRWRSLPHGGALHSLVMHALVMHSELRRASLCRSVPMSGCVRTLAAMRLSLARAIIPMNRKPTASHNISAAPIVTSSAAAPTARNRDVMSFTCSLAGVPLFLQEANLPSSA